jgi:N-acetyl-beta-hexosaminidase
VFGVYKDAFDDLGFDVTAQQVDDSYFASSSSFNHSSHIQCCVNAEVLPIPNSYRLHVSSQRVKITAADLLGVNYAISTFLQLLTLYSKDDLCGIPPLVINDHPSLKHRAVLIDVSQERIPTIVRLIHFIHTH